MSFFLVASRSRPLLWKVLGIGLSGALFACSSPSNGEPADASVGDAVVPNTARDASNADAKIPCNYKDFRGNDAVCSSENGIAPGGGDCPSPDGCNYAICRKGRLGQSLVDCQCVPDRARFADAGILTVFRRGTYTADDGCTVCRCGVDTGGPYLDFKSFPCDSSACPPK